MAIFSQYFAHQALHLAVQYIKMNALKSSTESYKKFNAKNLRFWIDLKLSQKNSLLIHFEPHISDRKCDINMI